MYKDSTISIELYKTVLFGCTVISSYKKEVNWLESCLLCKSITRFGSLFNSIISQKNKRWRIDLTEGFVIRIYTVLILE